MSPVCRNCGHFITYAPGNAPRWVHTYYRPDLPASGAGRCRRAEPEGGR